MILKLYHIDNYCQSVRAFYLIFDVLKLLTRLTEGGHIGRFELCEVGNRIQ